MTISTTNGFVTQGTTFADLLKDHGPDTSWYKIWNQQTHTYVTDGALAVNDGWVSAASLASMTVDLSGGTGKFYVRSYGSISRMSDWTDMTVSLATTDSYVTFGDTVEEEGSGILYHDLIETTNLSAGAQLRVWNASTNTYLGAEDGGDGWVTAAELRGYAFEVGEAGSLTNIWVDVYTSGKGRSGWENFTVTSKHTPQGTPDNDTLDGGPWDDQISGESGDDCISGGAGDDVLYGGPGDDHLSGGTGYNQLYGNEGVDTAVYTGEPADYSFGWYKNYLQIKTNASMDRLIGIEMLQIGDHTYQTGGVIAQDDALQITENDSILTSDLFVNDINLELETSLSLVTTGNMIAGTTTDGVEVINDNDELIFGADGTGYQYLGAGETLGTIFSYTITNESGIMDTATVTLTLSGENDAALFSGDVSGTIAYSHEQGDSTVSGDADNVDVDNVDDVFQEVAAGTQSSGGYGTYQVDTSGNWVYIFAEAPATVEILESGETVQDLLTLTAADGTTCEVDIAVGIEYIDFEDLADQLIPEGYKGFNWNVPGSQLRTLLGDDQPKDSGYFSAGTVVAYTPFAASLTFITRADTSDFIFKSVEMTSAWNATEDIRIEGYNLDVLVGSQDVQINNVEPTKITAEWGNIDLLTIDILGSSGSYNGDNVVFDNFLLI